MKMLRGIDSVEEIETAIDRSPPEDYRCIIAWLCEREQWDERLDGDSSAGRLDLLFMEAESESAAGLVRERPPRTWKSVAIRRFWELFHALPPDMADD